MEINQDRFEDEGVIRLLEEHLADMHANSPPESVHALDVDALKAADITFWCARIDGEAQGCIALKMLSPTHGEIKSMRTRAQSRGQGIGAALLQHLLSQASAKGCTKLSLETGSMDFFKPAHALYLKHGFSFCGPFGDYLDDPNSLFMEREL